MVVTLLAELDMIELPPGPHVIIKRLVDSTIHNVVVVPKIWGEMEGKEWGIGDKLQFLQIMSIDKNFDFLSLCCSV